jgi:hypothetical protein
MLAFGRRQLGRHEDPEGDPQLEERSEGEMSKRRGLVRSFRSDDLREACRRASRNGWASDLDGRGHVVMVSPDGSAKVRLSCTAFSGGATRAKVEEMKRKGALGPNRRSERAERHRRRTARR